MGTEAGCILAIVYNTVLDMNMQESSWCADLMVMLTHERIHWSGIAVLYGT